MTKNSDRRSKAAEEAESFPAPDPTDKVETPAPESDEFAIAEISEQDLSQADVINEEPENASPDASAESALLDNAKSDTATEPQTDGTVVETSDDTIDKETFRKATDKLCNSIIAAGGEVIHKVSNDYVGVEIKGWKLSPEEIYILSLIPRKEGISLHQLVKVSSLKASHTVEIIVKLENKKLLGHPNVTTACVADANPESATVSASTEPSAPAKTEKPQSAPATPKAPELPDDIAKMPVQCIYDDCNRRGSAGDTATSEDGETYLIFRNIPMPRTSKKPLEVVCSWCEAKRIKELIEELLGWFKPGEEGERKHLPAYGVTMLIRKKYREEMKAVAEEKQRAIEEAAHKVADKFIQDNGIQPDSEMVCVWCQKVHHGQKVAKKRLDGRLYFQVIRLVVLFDPSKPPTNWIEFRSRLYCPACWSKVLQKTPIAEFRQFETIKYRVERLMEWKARVKKNQNNRLRAPRSEGNQSQTVAR